MFRIISRSNEAKARILFKLHPADLSALLETAWKDQVKDKTEPFAAEVPPLGHPDHRSDLRGLTHNFTNLFPSGFLNNQDSDFQESPFTRPPLYGKVRWDHLIYAYMIESTRIYDAFKRVVHEFLHGENLGVPSSEAACWLRSTEELLYSSQPLFYIRHQTSDIRPDLSATRRNAYYRMFGMDLIHGKDNGQVYPYEKAKASNTEFVATFEEFLREVWVAIANLNNQTGENPTDEAAIFNLAVRLHDQLRARRQGGNLAREEFDAVSMMSWLHLTVSFNSPIVVAMRAEGSSPEQRLRTIGERVGLKVPAMAKSFFDIADPISRLLIFLETDVFTTAGGSSVVKVLFQEKDENNQNNPIQDDIREIITHWSLATGHDLKLRRTQQPVRNRVPA